MAINPLMNGVYSLFQSVAAASPRSESGQSSSDDSYVLDNRTIWIAAGAVVAAGVLCYVLRRPIGRFFSSLRSPSLPPAAPQQQWHG